MLDYDFYDYVKINNSLLKFLFIYVLIVLFNSIGFLHLVLKWLQNYVVLILQNYVSFILQNFKITQNIEDFLRGVSIFQPQFLDKALALIREMY